MGDLIKWIFSSTVTCVGKCGGEWVNVQLFMEIFLYYGTARARSFQDVCLIRQCFARQ